MHPAFLDNMSWEMAEVYGAITDQIMINLARHFPFYEYVSDVPTSAFAYQAKMLAQMGQVNKETVRIIRNGLEDADLALQGVLEQAIIDAVKSAEPELLEGVKKGVFSPATLPAVVAPNQMRAFQLYYQQAANKLNLVNTVMLESTQSAYQQIVSDVVNEFELIERINRTQIAIDAAAGETITGVSSWNQALKHATDRLKEGGITGFIDHAGRHWGAEGYVAMDIRTTVFNTARAATWEVNQGFGNDLYLVSYHNGARPLCYPWQNKVISATDNARTVVDLDGNEVQVIAQSDTSYGEAAGLFGINCKHYPTPFIPGVSLADGKPQDKAENDKVYAESQEQRRLERKIREEKRDLQMMKAQGAPEDAIAKQREKVKQSSADIDDFCRETGRARHRDREAVYTKREFPDADRYDPAAFKREQKELVDKFYKEGGEQQGFKFYTEDPETGERKTLTPKVPIEPPKPPVVQITPEQQPNPDVKTYGNAFDTPKGARKDRVEKTQAAKEALDKAPENCKKVWSKAADQLKEPKFDGRSKSAYYSPGRNQVVFKNVQEAFNESSFERVNTVFFHEYGHNLDNALWTADRRTMLSVGYKDNIFGKTIESECKEVITQWYLKKNGYSTIGDALSANGVDQIEQLINKKSVANGFVQWVRETYTSYERGDVSDIMESYMLRTYGRAYHHPFGFGHGYNYYTNTSAPPETSQEAFAEMFSATVTGNDTLNTIKEFFPKSYKIFTEMLESVIE